MWNFSRGSLKKLINYLIGKTHCFYADRRRLTIFLKIEISIETTTPRNQCDKQILASTVYVQSLSVNKPNQMKKVVYRISSCKIKQITIFVV